MKKTKKRFRLDITPLIDVVFLLLIFFMLTFSVQGQGIDINLPGENSEVGILETPLTLRVNEEGLVRINDEKIDFDFLVPELEGKFNSRKDKSLVVDIHKKVKYDTFVRVLDLAKKAGAENFSIIR
ncbi:MAG: biopolymer transporter ExbD [Nitrospinae bacterium]|nr:biopolymer transporter ExbD [Nitrospinota bacterium]MDA1109082.1 biopolymer transporter ExbD [Nitrospinota bacterium]